MYLGAFEWRIEFPEVLDDEGNFIGFDCIIGNPPYVEYNPKKFNYLILHIEKTINLYPLVVNRCRYLLNDSSSFGMIILLSFTSTERMHTYLLNFVKNYNSVYFSHYEGTSNPGVLFNGVKAQLCIAIGRKKGTGSLYTTHYNRFYANERNFLFKQIKYVEVNKELGIIPKTSDEILYKIENKLKNEVRSLVKIEGSNMLYYRNMGNFFWKLAFDEEPLYKKNGVICHSSTVSSLSYFSENLRDYYICFYNSSLFFMVWNTYSDCYHLSIKISEYKPVKNYSNFNWGKLSVKLLNSYKKNGYIQTENKKDGTIKEYYRYFPQYSKSEIDKIDIALAKYYDFTEEELDFIVNYDIKYRMGNEVNNEEE